MSAGNPSVQRPLTRREMRLAAEFEAAALAESGPVDEQETAAAKALAEAAARVSRLAAARVEVEAAAHTAREAAAAAALRGEGQEIPRHSRDAEGTAQEGEVGTPTMRGTEEQVMSDGEGTRARIDDGQVDEEATILVERSVPMRGQQAAAHVETPDDRDDAVGVEHPDEATVVVDRSVRPVVDVVDEATVVVDRSVRPVVDVVDEATVVVDRSVRPVVDAVDEATVVVERAEPSGAVAPASDPAAAAQTVAPAEAIYKPRAPQVGLQIAPQVVGAAAPTRVIDPERPSVSRQSRRGSRIVLGVLAGACVVSALGLVAVGILAFT